MHSHNYPGMYRGIVVDTADPLDAGRIRMMVPQLFGEVVTEWAWPVTGSVSQVKYPYGTFSSNQDQPVAAADTPTIATFNVNEDVNQTEIVDGTKIKVYATGDYFFQFSAQFSRASSSTAQADIWLRKNGVDIPRTNSRVTLQGNPNEVLLTLSYILDLKENDYVQVVFSSADSSVKMEAYSSLTTPARPDIPSIISTINLVGHFTPNIGSGVWAAFEGGDPNFPLWIGTF